jgi:phosphoserine phosphatase RsbU/P
MAAAFLMATTQLLVRTVIPRTPDPGACMTEVNRQLCTQAFNGQFVTMLIVLLDLEHGTLEVATAGHYPPLVDDGKGNFRALKMESQLVLAVEPDQVYITEKFHVASESAVVLYTDGIAELQAEDGTRYSTNDLIEALRGPTAVSQVIIDRTLQRVDQFRGKRDIDDDLTLVVMRMKRVTLREKVDSRK